MAKPRPEKKPAPTPKADEQRVLPMQLKIRDRLVDETGEYEVVGRPYMTRPARTRTCPSRGSNTDVTMIRTWGAHERVAVRRGG